MRTHIPPDDGSDLLYIYSTFASSCTCHLVRQPLPSLVGEGQGWGQYYSCSCLSRHECPLMGKFLLCKRQSRVQTPPMPLPLKGGECLAGCFRTILSPLLQEGFLDKPNGIAERGEVTAGNDRFGFIMSRRLPASGSVSDTGKHRLLLPQSLSGDSAKWELPPSKVAVWSEQSGSYLRAKWQFGRR